LRLNLPRLPRLPLAAFRRRLLLRAIFLAMLLGSVALALQLLADEKQRLQRDYEAGFRGRLAVLTERLRHPSGQLALLNADLPPPNESGWVPLRLPLGAIDFDDPFKAERALSLVDCWSRWNDGPAWCAGLGQRGSAGAFVYAVLRLNAPALQGRERGALDLAAAHRLRLRLQGGGEDAQWLAPLELNRAGIGQWPGFADVPGEALPRQARPDRDFRAWAWQDGRRCADDACLRDTLVSLRIPVAAWRGAAAAGAWPPPELARLRLQLQLLGPEGSPLFDSQQPGARSAARLQALTEALQPGERLRIAREGLPPIELRAPGRSTEAAIPWITRLVRRLPAARLEGPLQAEAELAPWKLSLHGDLGQVDRELAVAATRYSTTLALAAGGIALAWLLVELGLLRRMAQLTRRANALTLQLQAAPDQLPPLEVADLKGRDELGILAGTLDELLARVREQWRGEQLRAAQAREQ
jgi:hypothetical protein